MVIAPCSKCFSVVSTWTMLYCLDLPFHRFHNNHTSSSFHATQLIVFETQIHLADTLLNCICSAQAVFLCAHEM